MTTLTTATATVAERGPLAQIVDRYSEAITRAATGTGSTDADWEPLKQFVAHESFKRVGAYMEEMGWDEYVRFLRQWAGSTRFEMTVFRITEAGNVVVQEIEERHFKGDDFIRKNVVAIYEFDETKRIRHLDIYEQAKDTGRWIVEAAEASVQPGRP